MKAVASRYLSVPFLLRKTFQCPFPFTLTTTPNKGFLLLGPSQIRPPLCRLCCSTLPLPASSPSPVSCREEEEPQEIDKGAGHKGGFGFLLNTHKAGDLSVCDDEEEDENSYGNAGSHHVPVLLSEVIAAFQDVQLHTFVDCTLGAAGHASSIIMAHPELERFVGLDVDPAAHSVALNSLQGANEHRTKACTKAADLKLDLLKVNFRNIKNSLQQLGVECGEVDGVLMDLGMSSMQLNEAERGFSLQLDGPLDMRMDPMASMTASDILNNWPEAEIGKILKDFGEEKYWKNIAKKIREAQDLGGIHSTSSLLETIQKSLRPRFSPGRAGLRKTAIRVFQALRIAVNEELSSLRVALPNAFECLRPGGCLAVICFHSLEDRTVKQFFLEALGDPVVKSKKPRESNVNPSMPSAIATHRKELRTRVPKVLEGTRALILTKRPLTPGLDEVKSNPRARSAKLRVLVKK